MLETINNYSYSSLENLSLPQAMEILRYGSFEEKWVIGKQLTKFGERVIPLLREVINSENEDKETRYSALKILTHWKHQEVILIAVELLSQTKDEELMSLAIEALAFQGKTAVMFLSKLLLEENYCYLATQALSQIPSVTVIEPLLSMVDHPSAKIREMALSGLINFHDETILKAIKDALKDFASKVRIVALTGLSSYITMDNEKELISLISPLLKDIDLLVAKQASITLSKCEDDMTVKVLTEVLLLPITPLELKLTIIKSLAWMETDKSINSLGQYLAITKCEEEIVLIIKLFGRLKKVSLREEIVKILTNFYLNQESDLLKHSIILQNLFYTWKQLKIKEVLPLLKNLKNIDNQQVYFHLESAMINLSSC